jgi:hypothetical protein
MKPLIDQAFWSDPDIERNKPGVKLTALWLITNSQTSLLGVCGASVSRFEFETGIKGEGLQRALEALPRAFTQFGDVIFVRNYIRHQFGTGEKLMRNNFFTALRSLFNSVKDDELKAAILKEYPEFGEGLTKGLPSPYQGLTKPKDGKDRKEGGSVRGDAERIYAEYPNKVGKPDALRAIERCLKNYSADFLLERTVAFAKARRGDVSFCPHPSTWFNQERFNDAPSTWTPKTGDEPKPRVNPFAGMREIK